MSIIKKTQEKWASGDTNVLLKHGELADLLLIIFLWCLAALVVNIRGDFPLNDDWAYGITVKRLIEDGIYHPTNWGGMTLISQVLWGAIFCVPYGFSFTALRISTLIISLLGILSFYLLIRQLNTPRWLSVTVALILAFNPIYFALSYTFMTDVPFTAFLILSLLFLLKSLQIDSDIYLIIGTIWAIAATLCRQLGISIPMAFALTFLVKHGVSWKSSLKAIFPIAVTLSALILFNIWLEARSALPIAYQSTNTNFWNELQHPRFLTLIHLSYVMLQYLGFFLAPILLLLPAPVFRELSRARIISWGFGLLLIATLSFDYFSKGEMMPLGWGVLSKGGIGPITLRDTFMLNLPHMPELPASFWMLITMLSLLGSVILMYRFSLIIMASLTELKSLGKRNINIKFIFFLSVTMIYFMPLALNGFFDRYLIPLIPIMLAAIISGGINDIRLSIRRPIFIAGIVLLGLLALFSIITTKDYLEWNRVRWGALRNLMIQENITPLNIDGGVEFNAMYMYRGDSCQSPFASLKAAEYIVALGEIPGYEVLQRYGFFHWLPPQRMSIYILRRQAESK